MAAKRNWNSIFKMLRENDCQLKFCTNFLENAQDQKHFQTKTENLPVRFLEDNVIYIYIGQKKNDSRQAVEGNGEQVL